MNLVENAYLFAPKYELTNIGEKGHIYEHQWKMIKRHLNMDTITIVQLYNISPLDIMWRLMSRSLYSHFTSISYPVSRVDILLCQSTHIQITYSYVWFVTLPSLKIEYIWILRKRKYEDNLIRLYSWQLFLHLCEPLPDFNIFINVSHKKWNYGIGQRYLISRLLFSLHLLTFIIEII